MSKIISDPYRPPPIHSDDRHHGVDFSYHRWGGRGSILGVVVQAIFAGTVAAALEDTFPYGNVVIIETPGDWLPPALDEQLMLSFDQSLYILYAHMGKTPLVDRGELVSACQPIGEVGQSGNTIVAHLHVETRIGPPGATFTGMSRFIEDATPEEKANYKLWRTSGVFQHFDPMVLLLFDFEPEP